MKKINLKIIIAALVIGQCISILRINGLRRELQYINIRMNNLNNDLRDYVNNIYSNVDEMLKEEFSLIATSTTKIGRVNPENYTVPITFELTPKEVSENTMVSLDLDGELFPMEKNGRGFSATISRSIFSDALPKVIIDETGVKKTIKDESIGITNIKDWIFPVIHPRFIGQSSFTANTYSKKGELFWDLKKVEGDIDFEKIYLAFKVDDKLISKEEIPPKDYNDRYEVNKQIPLKDGEICTMMVIAIDSIGLEHHYMVDTWVGGSDMQREPGFYNEHIYSPSGELLWGYEF